MKVNFSKKIIGVELIYNVALVSVIQHSKSVLHMYCCSVAKPCQTLQPHGLRHARLLCPPLSPRVWSNSWSESVMLSNHLILCLPILFLASIFPSLFQWGSSWSIEASASASVLPMKIQNWFPFGLTGWISLLSKGLSRVFSSTTIWKHQFFGIQPSLWSNSHICTWFICTWKTITLTIRALVGIYSLFFRFFSHVDHNIVLSRVSCAIQ